MESGIQLIESKENDRRDVMNNKFEDLIEVLERMTVKMCIDCIKTSVLAFYVNDRLIKVGDIDLIDDVEFITFVLRCQNRGKRIKFLLNVLGDRYEINTIQQVQSLTFYMDWYQGRD